VDAIRGRITGGFLFPLRHPLPSFPQRGQCVIAEGQVWDGASFRSGLSGLIVLPPALIGRDNVKDKSSFHNKDDFAG
jgi:hypothetical protein